jgi:hypothetical protein
MRVRQTAVDGIVDATLKGLLQPVPLAFG